MQWGGKQQKPTWYKPRDDMDKQRSCANFGLADHHVADGLTYRQGMIRLGYAPDEEHMSQTEEHEFYSGLIIKIHYFRIDCPLLWEVVKNNTRSGA